MIREPLSHSAAMMKSEHESTNAGADPLVTAEGELLRSDPQRMRSAPIGKPQPGEIARITSTVSWIRIPLPIDLDHINVWLIEQDDGCILVDTGMFAALCKEAWEQIEARFFTRKPLRAIFITHLHPDHIGLAAWLQERHRVPVWMSEGTRKAAQGIYGSDGPTVAEVQAFLYAHGVPEQIRNLPTFKPERFARMTSGLPVVARYIEDEEQLGWSGEHWTAMRTDGHADGHLCLWNRTANVLISGDQVLPTISSNISVMVRQRDPNPLGSYLASLQRLRALPADTLVLPSHGMPFYGLQQRIDDLSHHHEAQLAKLLPSCGTPKTTYEILPVLFRRELGGMHLFLALGEAIAHLEYLAHAGTIERQEHAGVLRYVRR